MLRVFLLLLLVFISFGRVFAISLCQPGAYYSNSPSCKAGRAVSAAQQQVITPPIVAILGPAISQDDIGHILSSHYRDIPLNSYTDVESLGSGKLNIVFTAEQSDLVATLEMPSDFLFRLEKANLSGEKAVQGGLQFTAPTFVGLVEKLLPIAKLADKTLAAELQAIVNEKAELITNKNGQMYVRYILACGGSLVAKDKVLTAAHCIYDLDNDDITNGTYPIDQDNQFKRLVIGNDWTNSANKAYALKPVTVNNAAPGYLQGTNINPENDFAILTLATPAATKPMLLDANVVGSHYPSLPMMVSGWGMTEPVQTTPASSYFSQYFSIMASPDMLSGQNSFVSQSACTATYVKQALPFEQNMLCAGTPSEVAFCDADSGSPLYYSSQPFGSWQSATQFTQVGVVSGKGKQCDNDVPGLYSQVSRLCHTFAKWLSNFDVSCQ